jgi:hypothetical protein
MVIAEDLLAMEAPHRRGVAWFFSCLARDSRSLFLLWPIGRNSEPVTIGTNRNSIRSFRSITAETSRMTDEQLALQAVKDAQRILEEYLEPRPRNNERIILDRLVEVLERPDLVVAVDRMQRAL